MNIVHVSGGNYGGVPFRYSDLINKHTSHHSRLITLWQMHQKFPCDIVLNAFIESADSVKQIIDEAEIFHVHEPFIGVYNSGETVEHSFLTDGFVQHWVNSGLDKYFRERLARSKVVVTHHGIPLRTDYTALQDFHEKTKYVATVTTPDLKQFLPKSIWIPHPVDPEQYPRLNQTSEEIRICHSTSSLPVHTTEQIIKLLREAYDKQILKISSDVELIILMDMPYEDVIKEKSKSHINVGRLGMYANGKVYGLYNMGDLEAMVMGLPSMSHLDGTIRMEVPDIPIIDVSCETFIDKISKLIEDKALRTSLGRKSRQWVLKRHSPKVTLNKLMEIYEGL